MPREIQVVAPVAVVMSRFPVVTETFILRELVELERQGQPVVLVPLLRQAVSVVHEEARAWIPRAQYTPFLSAEIVRENARALARHPRTTLRALGAAIWHARSSWNALVGTIGIFPKSAFHAARLRRLGVQHVHAHFATHGAQAAALVSRLSTPDDLPYSVTVHAHDVFVTQAGLRAKLDRAAFVRCISDFNANFLVQKVGIPPGRCRVLHCGIEPDRYARAPLPGRPGRARAARIACIASLQEYKGVTHLVEAVRLLREQAVDLACEVIGEGPLRARLQAQAAAARLGERIRFVGTRTQDDVAAAMRTADVFVLPSVVARSGQMEGIPVSLMEAMAAGVPVVATRLSGIPELVEDGETGLLVEPGDARALAAAIRRILDDPDAAAAMALRARARVRERFDVRAIVTQLAAAFEEHGSITRAPREARDLARRAAEIARVPAGAARIGLVRWSEGRDARVVEVLLPASPGGSPRRLVAKQHLDPLHARTTPRARAENEHRALVALRAQGLAVPRAVGLDAPAATVVMGRFDGTPLSELLRRHRLQPPPLAHAGLTAAGRWLAAIAACAGPPRDRAAFARGAVVARLLAELRDDASKCVDKGLPAARVERLVRACEEELRRATAAAAACWTHGDFWPGNVLVDDGGRPCVVDLEGLRPGFMQEDAAQFLEHLALRWRPDPLLESSFLSGLGRRAPRPAWRLAKVLRLAAVSPEPLAGRWGRRIDRRLRELQP
jgi:glycosyltransferase involved in cell wall biosynthesis/aminoglycoside phosphotransferase (APT) family kinase protein